MSVLTTSPATKWTSTLVDLLIASGELDAAAAEEAVSEAASSGRAITALLVARRPGSSAKIARYLSGLSGSSFVDLSVAPPEARALAALSSEVCRRHHVVGYVFDDEGLVLVASEPLEVEGLDDITTRASLTVTGYVIGEAHLVEALIDARASKEASGSSKRGRLVTREPRSATKRAKGASGGLDELLRAAVAAGASDLHLSAGAAPSLRVDGAIRAFGDRTLTADEIDEMVFAVLSSEQRQSFEKELELDASYALADLGRFRISVFRQRGSVGAVIRMIPNAIPPFSSLGLPDVVSFFAELRHGLVLVTGPTGSGKSTTLASIVDLINESRPVHIMTVEDPIEFEHENRCSIVNQREVGVDTRSFGESLRHVLRQDPDVILVGEMRDLETIGIALTAAETGHLVLSTLHTPDAPQTIDRIIDVFPSSQQPQIRLQLAAALQGVVTQQLVIGRGGSGRVPVAEVLLCSPAVRNLVRSGKTHQLDSLMQSSGDLGMQTMDLGLARAVKAGLIAESVAFDRSHDPEELREYLGNVVGKGALS